jgi:hypothetical protein
MIYPMSANLMGLMGSNTPKPEPEPQGWWDQNNRRDKAAMMLAAAGDAFGNMTLRGRQGSNPFGQAIYAQASQNIKNNRTLEYLKQNHPDMYQLAMQVGTENLPTIITQMMKNKVSGGSDYEQYKRLGGKLSFEDWFIMQSGTAGQKNSVHARNLPPGEREAFLDSIGPSMPFQIVNTPGGGLAVLDKTKGITIPIVSDKDARSGRQALAVAETLGEKSVERFSEARGLVLKHENDLTSMIDSQLSLRRFLAAAKDGNVDTGILVGRLGRIAPWIVSGKDQKETLKNLASMDLEQIDNLMRQLGYVNLAPVTIEEIKLLSKTGLDVMNSEEFNVALAEELLEKMKNLQGNTQKNLFLQLRRMQTEASTDAARENDWFQREYQANYNRLYDQGYLDGF